GVLAPTALAQTTRPGTKPGSTTGKKPAPPVEPKVVKDVLAPGVPGAEQVGIINQEIRKLWDANKITPSHRCSDYDFISRVTLDITGRMAKVEKIDRFTRAPETPRRSLLIERLLNSDEYAKNWSNIWTVWLMTRGGALGPNRMYHEQMQVWLDEQFGKKSQDAVGFDQI